MKKTSPLILAMTVLLSFEICLAENAYDFYVDGSYSGEEDGSEEKPFNTVEEAIQAATNASSDQRKIFVKDGTYGEELTLEESTKLYGGNDKKVFFTEKIFMNDKSEMKNIFLSGKKDQITVDGEADVVLENLEIKDFKNSGINALPGSGNVRVINCSISGFGKGIFVQGGREVEISGNNIYGNQEEGIDLRESVSGKIENNIISSNLESGIEVILGGSILTISRNTISGNQASGITYQYYKSVGTAGKVNVSKNTLTNNKKYAHSCGIPSGGKPKLSYWRKSLTLSSNTAKKNKKGTKNPYCGFKNKK